jgi:hypothetical protein
LAEHWSPKPAVGGSIPFAPAVKKDERIEKLDPLIMFDIQF